MELGTGADAELAEYLVQVVVDGALAEVQAGGDLGVGQSLAGQAAWALVSGVIEIVSGFGSGETAGTRALFILSGLVSVAFGILLFARPGVGAVTLALLLGLYSLIYGFSQITAGVQVRQVGKSVQPLSELRNAA